MPARVDRSPAVAIFRRLRDLALPRESESPCGGIGRRARLKIEFRKECWFDSGQGHQERFHSDSQFSKGAARLTSEKLRCNTAYILDPRTSDIIRNQSADAFVQRYR
jgi:hypothetical protein